MESRDDTVRTRLTGDDTSDAASQTWILYKYADRALPTTKYGLIAPKHLCLTTNIDLLLAELCIWALWDGDFYTFDFSVLT